MKSQNLTAAERSHFERIKMMDCAVCGEGPPNDAHHIDQGHTFTCIPLCKDCHQGSLNGIHGQRGMWKVMKKTEQSCLNETIREMLKC